MALYGDRMPQSHKKTIQDIMECRNGSFGTMVYECSNCRNLHFIHCCCGNRHCPNCQQSKADQWLSSMQDLFVHTKPLEIIFKAKFKNAMKKAGLLDQIDPAVWKQKWVIDSQSVGQGQNSLRYLARYVFRVAISNNRIKSIENDVIKFSYKDREKKKWKIMALDAMEFIRRFLQHVLPKGFMKIRHYGFLNPNCALSIEKIRKLISFIHDIIALFTEIPEPAIPGIKCSHCGHDLKFILFVKPEPRGKPG